MQSSSLAELLNHSWREVLADELQKPYFGQLSQFVESEYASKDILPPREFVFRAFDLCSPQRVKVVIIGQDPYPTKGHANGLSFSVDESVRPLPKSLQNIFKEINRDLGVAIPTSGTLERWASQGVLMVNSVLTVEQGVSLSHKSKGWESFTDAVVRELSDNVDGVVYMLWGKDAQRKGVSIDRGRNLVLESSHPSPLAVYRGFDGCGHFSKANDYLLSIGREPIIW